MAIANPEELIKYSNILEHYVNTIERETDVIVSAFSNLKMTWQDEKAAAFEETLNELINVFNNFKSNASEQIPYVRMMAEDLKTYLRR